MTELSPDSGRPSMRASDQDRERAAEILREAAGDGRLSMTELDERLDAVYAAKTYADIEPIIHDLPHGGAVAAKPASTVDRFGGQPTSSSAVAIMGGFSRKGAWVVPANFTAAAFMAGGELDLREARFSEPTVSIHAIAIMAGISIIVPLDADVQVSGIGVMGAFEHASSGPGQPGGPKIRVNGFAFWGAVEVKRKAPKGAKKRRDVRGGPRSPELEPGPADEEHA
jgi:Domain of unknown function (DUF1707)